MTVDLHVETLSGLATRGEGQSVADLWDAAERLGYPTATVPGNLGGGGGSLRDGAEIARAASRVRFDAPLAQAVVVFGPLLTAAGWTLGEGVPAIIVDPRGSARPLPVDFGVDATTAYVVTPSGHGSRLVEVDLRAGVVRRGPGGRAVPAHVAQIELGSAPVLREAVLEEAHEHWAALAALAAAVQIDGAVRVLVDRTADYLGTRTQFGRPLMKFQALQHRVAEMVTWAELLTHAVDEAVHRWHVEDAGRIRASAVAKIEAGRVGLLIAAETHQLHGAIGYTEESGIGEYSKLIWSQNDRGGSWGWWSSWLGGHDSATDPWTASAPLGALPERSGVR